MFVQFEDAVINEEFEGGGEVFTMFVVLGKLRDAEGVEEGEGVEGVESVKGVEGVESMEGTEGTEGTEVEEVEDTAREEGNGMEGVIQFS